VSYTQIVLFAVPAAILIDLFLLKTRLVTRKSFWTTYLIMLFFQLVTNWWLTSRGILTYDENVIIGARIASAPVEDLLFGFAMILISISFWIFWGKRNRRLN
jgi:lycopene cyclase domain-containing protein